MFYPPKHSITKCHEKPENLGQKPRVAPCHVFPDTHTFVVEKNGTVDMLWQCAPHPANLTCVSCNPAQVITTSGGRNGCVWS